MSSNQVELRDVSPTRMCSSQVQLFTTGQQLYLSKPLTPTAPPEHLFDTKDIQVDLIKEPSAPLDYMVGIKPDWLPVDITIEELSTTFYLTNTMLLRIQSYVQSTVETDAKNEDGDNTEEYIPESWAITSSETSSDTEQERTPQHTVSAVQGDDTAIGDSCVNHKRKRSGSDSSLTDIDQHIQSSKDSSVVKISKNKMRKRKLKKGMAITAWAFASPVMIGINLLREKPKKDDDEDDKRNDPLRPWNYDVTYVKPH